MKLKILFFPIALFVAFMITIFFTKPEWDIYQEKQEELTKLTMELDDLKSGNASIENATKKFNSLTPDQESLVLNAIPSEEKNDDFLAEVHKSAETSGVFIISTKIKNPQINRANRNILPGSLASMTPTRTGVTAEVSVMGSYIDIAEFVKEVDSHNRFTTPRELLIIEQQVIADVAEEEISVENGSMIKCELTFDFFSKEKNEKLQIANLIRANDPVIKSLLSGQLKTGIIEDYQNSITREVFRPVSAGSAGKEDIFSR